MEASEDIRGPVLVAHITRCNRKTLPLEYRAFHAGASSKDTGWGCPGIGLALTRVIKVEENMFAVFQSGGKQHRVSEGDVVKLEKLTAEPGQEVVFDQVLMVSNGNDVNVGAPFVEGGQVKAEVMRTDRGRKIRVIKFKRRKDFLRRQGHRKWFTEVKITAINGAS